jgi:hypothetical protein
VFGDAAGNGPAAVLLGSKLVLYRMVKKRVVARSPPVVREESNEDTWAMEGVSYVGEDMDASLVGSNGTVIFHIDATSSMSEDKRMELVKAVLLRVIPLLLSRGLRIILNAWASNQATQGQLQTRELTVTHSLLDPEEGAALAHHITETVFCILQPGGRTDLYGSLVQLFAQAKVYLSAGPVHSFVLTDGNHNFLGAPILSPTTEGESYFGLYRSKRTVDRELKWERTTTTSFPAEGLRACTAQYYAAAQAAGGEENSLSLTLIGIGDAATGPLQALSTALGETCRFVGISQVDQADEVFQTVSTARQNVTVTVSGRRTVLPYCMESTEETETASLTLLNAAVTVIDDSLLLQLHAATALQVHYGSGAHDVPLAYAGEVPATLYPGMDRESSPQIVVEQVMTALGRLRSRSYEVTADTLLSVFRSLMADKRTLFAIKSSLLSKGIRRVRRGSAVFAALGVWLRELEDLVDAQVAAYRMNVEQELFAGLSAGRQPVDPGKQLATGAALDRLRHNVSPLILLSIDL